MKSRYLTDQEISLIFAHFDFSQRLVFEVSFATGLRIGDVLKIRKRDLKRVSGGGCEISFVAEKTKKKGKAVVYGEICEHLFLLAKRTKSFLWASRAKCGHITRQTAWNWIKAAAEAAEVNLKGVSPHSLRKCFAVRVRHKEGLEAARRALQHSCSEQTAIYAYADVYAGAYPDAPVLWCQIDELVDLIAAKLKRNEAKK